MQIHGEVAPGFEPVRDAFRANFTHRGEVGAGLVVRRHGEVVVDLWGGEADPEGGRPWERDTPVVVFSATKGMVAAALLMLTDQGALDPDAPVADVWPELARHGKERITARMILNHRAGLSALDMPLTLQDFDAARGRVHDAMVAQVPLWEPDTDQGYAACSYGAYTGELVRRLTGKSVGAWFDEHIATPLGLDAWIGLPEEQHARVARLLPVGRSERVREQLPQLLTRSSEGRVFRRVVWEAARKRGETTTGRAFLNPALGPRSFDVLNDPEVLALELPWMGGVATADALSAMYGSLIGEVDGVQLVRPERVRPIRHRQSWSERDRVLHKRIGWSQGFLKEERTLFSPNPASFGHAGAGGALGWADPDAGIALGYTMNKMDWRIRSPRALALCHAVYGCL
jgi:CubicO group peptidase (beta-lactamase class C family)